jgi:hypothetical protein
VVASEDDVKVVGDSDGRGGEGDEASSIAKLSHGDEGCWRAGTMCTWRAERGREGKWSSPS